MIKIRNIVYQKFAVILTVLFASVCSVQAQGAGTAVDPAPSKLGAKYTHTGFGFEMSLPKDWYVADSQELELLADAARKNLKKGYKLSTRAVLEQKRIENVAFAISKKRVGTARNSALGLGTVVQPNSQTTVLVVAESTVTFFLKDTNNKLAKSVSTRKIDGREFAEFDMTVSSKFGKQNVRVLITNLKGYSLTFALTYWDDLDDLKLMMATMESIRFITE